MDADISESRSHSELPRGAGSVICGTGTNATLVIGSWSLTGMEITAKSFIIEVLDCRRISDPGKDVTMQGRSHVY